MGSLLLTMSLTMLRSFVISLICSPCMGQIRTSADLQNQVTNLVGVIGNLQTATRNLQRTTNTATNAGTEIDAVADYVLTGGSKCGPQTIQGWSEKVDYVRTAAVVSATNMFDATSGTLTPPQAGYYHICAYSRFQNSGNAVEMCIRKGSQRIACYGNAVQYDWRSTGACTTQLLATTDSVPLYLESGGSQDCIQETGWLYNRISIQLIQQTVA